MRNFASIASLYATLSTNVESFTFVSLTRNIRSSALAAKKKIFIDGEAGTTGLQVFQRLSSREDLEIISPPEKLRKDADTRKNFINEADAVILCLPDAASIEAASFVEPDNDRTVLIDASTAFRIADDWDYGFPGEQIRFDFFCNFGATQAD